MDKSKACSKIWLLEGECLRIISSRSLFAKYLAKKCPIRSYARLPYQALGRPLHVLLVLQVPFEKGTCTAR